MKLNIYSVKEKMIWFLLPLILFAVSAMTLLSFYVSNKVLSDQYVKQMDSVESSTVHTMQQLHAAFTMLDIQLEEQMKYAVVDFKERFEREYPGKTLAQIKADMGNQYDLIVIDDKTTIVDATMPEALGFNFSTFDSALGERTNAIRFLDDVVHEHIRTNVATGLLSKFSYVASDDKNYILEIVFSNDRFSNVVNLLEPIQTMNEIVETNPIVKNIFVYDVYGYRFTNLGELYEPTPHSKTSVEKALLEGRYEETTEEYRRRVIYLKDQRPSQLSDHSKVIEIHYDDQAISQLNVRLSLIVFSVGIIIGLAATMTSYVGIKRITKPLTNLSNAALRISEGDYSITLNEEGDDELGQLTRTFNMMAHNIKTASLEKVDQIEFLSYHDQLTGLYNRHFYEKTKVLIDHSATLPLSIAMVDVNGLKLINDAFGHMVGDELLVKASEILRSSCRNGDIIARVGGDEFIILMPMTPEKTAQDRVAEIEKRIKSCVMEKVILSVSCGLATRYTLDESIDDLYKVAEERMYRRKLTESVQMRYEMIEMVKRILHNENPREKLHAERVRAMSLKMAELLNISDEEKHEISMAAMLHDIGKIAINVNLLDKKAPLSEAERLEVEKHPEVGYQILKSVNEYVKVSEIVLAHHERWDGTGYPRNLAGDQIPIGARIISLCNYYDVMMREQIEGGSENAKDIKEKLERASGTLFDPQLVTYLLKILE